MRREPTQDDLQHLVAREVHYCVSHLVATLAQGYGCVQETHGNSRGNDANLVDLIEQAFELASPIPDYEEAAIQAGWKEEDRAPDGQHVFHDSTDGQTWCAAGWQELCEDHDIEPYDREVFEHWIVSDWLADKLADHGEKVDKDFAGMTVWARTCSGQGIASDGVIEAIWRDLHKDD